MNFDKAIAKVEKMTGQTASVTSGKATIFYKGYRIEFFINGTGPNATCYSTCREDLQSDSMTDYFPQTFHDNITQCVKHIDRMVPEYVEPQPAAESVDNVTAEDAAKRSAFDQAWGQPDFSDSYQTVWDAAKDFFSSKSGFTA